MLEHIQKLTDKEHPDLESLPLILNILSDFIKSTQPGIAAAESKVKFWGLCESLVYQKGEIIVSYKRLILDLLGIVDRWNRTWIYMMIVGRWYIQGLWRGGRGLRRIGMGGMITS